MKNGNLPQSVDPSILYTPNSLAAIFQVDEKWVKTHMIYNRSCRFRKQGAVYMILGRWVIEWAETEHDYPGKDE